MEKITGKLGSKLIILALLFLMPENLFAKPKSAAIKYSEYGVFWDFEDQFFEDFDINEPWTGDKIFEFDKTFRLCKKNTGHAKISITNFKTTLSYDVLQLKKFSSIYNKLTSKLMFHKTDCGIDMLVYNCLNDATWNLFANACVIHFDFKSKTVTTDKCINISHLMADFIFEYGYNDFMKNIYDLYFCGICNLKKINFIQGGDDTCGVWWEPPAVFSDKTLRVDLTKYDVFEKQWAKLVGKAPDKVLPDREIIHNEVLVINNYEVTSKSFLREGSVNYTASNLKSFSDTPWVPSIDYKEELLTITSEENIGALSICNGFFRTGRQDLYNKNSRVKEIEIIYPESYGITHRVILNDTGYPQYIPLINNDCKELKIKIISVYEGSKYSDVCINCICPIKQYDAKAYYIEQNRP